MTPDSGDPTGDDLSGQIKRNPVPSLLRSLLTDHLDPGYADEARLYAAGERQPASKGTTIAWLVSGALVIGVIFGTSAAHENRRTPDTVLIQQEMAADARAQQAANQVLADERDTLADRESGERSANLAGDEEGGNILRALRAAQISAAATSITGPGLVVKLADPPPRPDLSDKARPSDSARGQVILDRDLQAVINGLWAGGAEAIAVGGVRIGPSVSIRQAGGAILVDNQPVPSPYVVEAIGDAGAMQAAYILSPAFLRVQSLQQLYGASINISTSESLQLPDAPVHELRYAEGN